MTKEKKAFTTPVHVLNKAYRKQKIYRGDIEAFKSNLSVLLQLNEQESEEHVKNDVIQFLNDTWYKGEYAINTKGRTDLVIHNDKTTKSTAGVLLEVKKPSNKSEMVSQKKLNAKALQELVLYYLRERIENENTDIKHLVVTNVYEWFVFDAAVFYNAFYKNAQLVKSFKEWNTGQKDSTKTELFYKDIAAKAIDEKLAELTYTWFDFREYEKDLAKDGDSNKLIGLYKLLSPVHLLKQSFANDSNSLNKQFYNELLHIIGLEEVKDKGKKVIQRKEKGKRNEGSLLENAIMMMDERDRLRMLDRPSHFGKNTEEQAYNVGLELCITWINRVLFLKLLESQLVAYHKGDMAYRFLEIKTVADYDELESLFFGVLAKKTADRSERYKEKFAQVPYLNSSLFEPTGLEEVLTISMLSHSVPIKVYSQSVLKDDKGKRITGTKDPLTYLFAFLEAYDFSSEGKEAIQDDSKSLINASVLGLIFEKINGYKDGSFYTPGFITMYMCRETLRRAVVQKFNEAKGWSLENFDQLYDKIDDKKEANDIINSLKICDPAVGSGHFLVSALNEMITIKSELQILMDKEGKTLRDYDITIENDELIISDDNGEFFDYTLGSKEKQRVQETLFHEKQTIIENCLFGVDINPNSVKICRLRLWIELLKNAYYLTASEMNTQAGDSHATLGMTKHGELQTLPNIDINIKTGNSLISRFDLDTDISDALKKSKWDINTYRNAVDSYKNATSKEDKREFERLIDSIKGDFETEISKRDKRLVKANKLKAEVMKLTQQTDLFGLAGAKKKAWEKDVNDKTKALQKLEQELAEVKNNKIFEDAFEWRFEFPEVLDDVGNFMGFDVVIGNPPYIRQEELADIKPYLSNNFKTFTGTADLYVYFVELGMNLLQSDGGFTFITPNKWMRAGYGQKLRHFVKGYQIHELLDFGDLPVFEEATTYPMIMELSKSEAVAEFSAVNFDTLDFKPNMKAHVESRKMAVLIEKLSDKGWTLTDSKVQNLLAKLRAKGKPLGEYVNGKIYYGIKTGLNEAFVIDKMTKDQLIENDPKSAEIIKPFLSGREIKRYCRPEPEYYLIFTRRGIDIDNYPIVKKHLERFKEKLEPKPKGHKGKWDGRKPGSYKWYEIQDAIDYHEEFEEEKIVWAETSFQNQFTIIQEGIYLNKTTFIMGSKDLGLLALLNSSIARFFFSSIVSKVRGGYFSMSKAYVETFLITDYSTYFIRLEDLVKKILAQKRENPQADIVIMEKEIDQLVYELYGLTEEEIKIVEEATK